jgi:hypothetical protein
LWHTASALGKYLAKSVSQRAIRRPPQPIGVWPVLVGELARDVLSSWSITDRKTPGYSV